MMKFIDFMSGGEPESMSIGETVVPEIEANEVLIEVKCAGVNRADTLQRQGKYPAPTGESEILGLEVSGLVIKTGAAVTQWQPGDKVFGLVPGGGYAEFCKVKASHLIAMPNDWSFALAASVAEVFLTAYQAMFKIASIQQTDTVLIHAGASGVGTAAIQLAKTHGARVIVTASSEEKLTLCKKLGADLGINYKTQDFVAEVKQFAPKGVNVIIDFVAGEYLAKNINCAAMDAHIVILAMLGGRFVESLDMAKMLGKRINISGSTLRNRSDNYKQQLVESFTRNIMPKFTAGTLEPVIDSILPWHMAGKAHQMLETNQSAGKVVLDLTNN